MNTYAAATYGERCADVYDDWYQTHDEAAITTLVELSRGGRVLELGIGTGRIALPLVAQQVQVHGIDASPAMVARLKAKPESEKVPVAMGDFADVDVEGQFSLIYVVFNTFFGLLSQDEQVRCFRNVAQHLAEDGVFLIEAFVPDLTRFSGGQNTRTSTVTDDLINIDVTLHDPVEQRLTGQHLVITEAGVRLYPVQLRYAWPSELDLMAQLAGLRLRHRWSSWQLDRFTNRSDKHISVYERMGGA